MSCPINSCHRQEDQSVKKGFSFYFLSSSLFLNLDWFQLLDGLWVPYVCVCVCARVCLLGRRFGCVVRGLRSSSIQVISGFPPNQKKNADTYTEFLPKMGFLWNQSFSSGIDTLFLLYMTFAKKKIWYSKTLENDRFPRIPILGKNTVYVSVFFFWIKEKQEIIWIDYNRTPRATRPNRLLTRHTRMNTRHPGLASIFWAVSCKCRVGARSGRITLGMRSPSIQVVSCLPPDLKKIMTPTQDFCLKFDSSEIDHFQAFLVSYIFYLTKVM